VQEEGGSIFWTIFVILLCMTAGFFIALFVYTRIIRREVNQQLSLEVNKMVENYVNLAEKKSSSDSYVKI
jgi:predicted permease